MLQNDSPAMKKAVSLLSLTTPNSNRKRRRLRDTLAQLTKETEISPFPPPRKRPSAEHNLSMASLLDISNTPDTCKALAGNDGGGGNTGWIQNFKHILFSGWQSYVFRYILILKNEILKRMLCCLFLIRER